MVYIVTSLRTCFHLLYGSFILCNLPEVRHELPPALPGSVLPVLSHSGSRRGDGSCSSSLVVFRIEVLIKWAVL